MEGANSKEIVNIQEASVVVAPEKAKRFNLPKIKLPIIEIKRTAVVVAAIIFAVSLLFTIVYFVYKKYSVQPPPVPTPTPIETPKPVEEVDESSPYAEDEDVLTIEVKIRDIEKALQRINLREDRLRVPSLDWQINFDK